MLLKTENAGKRFFRKTGEANYFYAVRPVSLEIEPGKLTALTGRSGSGKTTLLHMLSGLLTPSEGRVLLDDKDLYTLDDRALSHLRNDAFGVIPQGRSAIDTLTVMENVLLPGVLYGSADREASACQWMERLGVSHLADAYPAELSGGELRRMAVARALAGDPGVILADEPTGDLDDENTSLVLSALRQAADQGKAVFLVTHESAALPFADRAFRMDGGALTEMEAQKE